MILMASIFIIFSALIASYILLNKHSQLFILDIFSPLIAVAYMIGLMVFGHSLSVASLGNLAANPVAVIVLATIINYLKLLFPKKKPKAIFSFLSLCVLLITTTILWYFFPTMGN